MKTKPVPNTQTFQQDKQNRNSFVLLGNANHHKHQLTLPLEELLKQL